MKLLKSLVRMVMKINNERKQPKNKNTALKSKIQGSLGGNSNYKLPKTQFHHGSLPAHSTQKYYTDAVVASNGISALQMHSTLNGATSAIIP
jgi:hypothetical protein